MAVAQQFAELTDSAGDILADGEHAEWTPTAALQQGVVDGEENPTSMIQVAKLYEVQKYLTLDGHVFGVEPFSINEKFYQSLPEDLRYIVADSARIGAMAYRGLLEFGNALDIQDLAAKGMVIYAPSPQEIAKFKEATQGPVKECPYNRERGLRGL